MVKVKVPSASFVAKKWGDVTPARATFYEQNATVAGTDWENGATAGASNLKAAVQAANFDKLYTGGVKGKATKYNRKVKDVGVSRFGPGVTAAVSDMQTGVDPYLAEIAATELTARKPRGDPTNFQRVNQLGTALNKKRLALLASTA